MTVRLRYTLIIEYEANPEDYEEAEGDPEEMAKMDLQSVQMGEISPFDFLGDHVIQKVEVVE